MLSISRWMAAAILVTVTTVSAMAIPNFLPEKTFQSLPRWAQHRVVPGIEYQGGSRFLFEVDANAIYGHMIEKLRDDVRRILREAKVGLLEAPVVRGPSVEVRIRESDFERGFMALHVRLVLPYQGELSEAQIVPVRVPRGTVSVTSGWAPQMPPDLTIESRGGGLVRLALTEFAIREQIQQSRRQSVDYIRRYLQQVGTTGVSVEPRGIDRIEVVTLGLDQRQLPTH